MILNKYKNVGILILVVFGLTYCVSPNKTVLTEQYTDNETFGKNITISGSIGKGHNHPSFVIWQENMQGEIMRTLFITKSYASGIFGHANVSDSTWLDQPGKSYQPSALPYWTMKKGKIANKTYVPTPENPFVDAVSGATPIANFVFSTQIESFENTRILMEVNQAWDWNDYWTNDKFIGSESYKHSAQPSLIYSVTLNNIDSVFYLNPIGHGDPRGESGKLFTDLNGFTTAKEIFKEIKIIAKN